MNTANVRNKDLPAFSCVAMDRVGNGYQQDWLLKRELFATNAHKAIISNADTLMEITRATNALPKHERDAAFFNAVARISVQHADALLAALEE